MATAKELSREAGIEEIAGWMKKHKEFVWCISDTKEVARLKKRFPGIATRIVLAGEMVETTRKAVSKTRRV